MIIFVVVWFYIEDLCFFLYVLYCTYLGHLLFILLLALGYCLAEAFF